MRPHRVVVLDVLTKHPPRLPFVDGDDVIEALAPERPDHPLGDGVGVRRAQRSQNRLDPDPSSACDEVPAIATVAVSDEEPWLLTRAVASIICLQIQGAIGCAVTFQCRMRRRSWSITMSTERVRKVRVCTVHRSAAQMLDAWLCRDVRHD